MGSPKWEYPEKKELQKLCSEIGGYEVAKRLGMAATTLKSHCQRHGIEFKKNTARVAPIGTVSELEIANHKIKELEAAQRSKRVTDVRDERIIREFKEAIPACKSKYKSPSISKKGEQDHEHILLLSDLHANEVVSYEETLGLNAYDWQIMIDRLRRVQESVLSFQEHRPYPIRKLNVWMLGDMTSGSIHDELVETNEFPHEHAVVQLGYDLGHWLEEFIPYYPDIEVCGVVGNHPRKRKKPQSKAATDNSDWTLYKFIETYHRLNEQIQFKVPNAKFQDVVVAERWRAFLMHGDGIRSTMVDVPWGGVIRKMGKYEAQFQQAGMPIDFFACGHYHQSNDVRGVSTRLYMNGSVKGLDEFTLDRYGAGQQPQQLLLTVNKHRGVTDVSYIDCVDVQPNAEAVQRRLAA
jgi:hypothetical protein